MTLAVFVVAGVVVGAVHGRWWATAGALVAGAFAYFAADQHGAERVGTAISYTLATGAGLGIGVAARRRGPRSVPPTG